MVEYIHSEKNGIHIVDIVRTRQLLADAAAFLQETAKAKHVMFVGSKRQAAEIVQKEAQRVGAYFVVDRWPGGLFTNFDMAQQSLSKLRGLEKQFEEGVQDRTKYEIMQMKTEWQRLSRLYRGVKDMSELPGAIVVIDPRFERVASKEARLVGIPVVALTDTNCNPRMVDYIIPGNDDALKAIEMVITTLAEAVLIGNEGKGVKHNLREYSEVEVEIIRTEATAEEEEEVDISDEAPKKIRVSAASYSKASGGKGILEQVKEEADKTKAKSRKISKT
jgi:small subunit ribosomal protein S2